eukprot:4351676-Pleurochrysis_carterae.AAC.1
MERNLRLNDPSLRLEYTHHLLHELENRVDDFRDKEGSVISKDEFEEMVTDVFFGSTLSVARSDCEAAAHSCQPEVVLTQEHEIFSQLAYESFIEAGDAREKCSGQDQHQATDPSQCVREYTGCVFTEYATILQALPERLWTWYDMHLHRLTRQMYESMDSRADLESIAHEIVMHQVSFDETSSECMETVFYVLKMHAPCRAHSQWQDA